MRTNHAAGRTRKLRITAATLLCSLFAAAAAQPAFANLVSDPGFENAAVGPYTGPIGDGWDVTQGTVYIASDSVILNIAHSGQQAALLDYGTGTNVLSQALATTSGQSYTISFFVSDDTGGNDLTVDFGSTPLFSGTTALTGVGTYDLFTYMATASSSSTDLSFAGTFTNTFGFGTILDDVSVTPSGTTIITPEPAAALLLSGGAVLLGGIRRGRRRRQR